jgi:hypothetical protein
MMDLAQLKRLRTKKMRMENYARSLQLQVNNFPQPKNDEERKQRSKLRRKLCEVANELAAIRQELEEAGDV